VENVKRTAGGKLRSTSQPSTKGMSLGVLSKEGYIFYRKERKQTSHALGVTKKKGAGRGGGEEKRLSDICDLSTDPYKAA